MESIPLKDIFLELPSQGCSRVIEAAITQLAGVPNPPANGLLLTNLQCHLMF